MADYILRGIPNALWAKAKRQAEKDGHTLKWLLIRWLTDYTASVSDSKSRDEP